MHDILRIHKFQHMGAIRAFLLFGLVGFSLNSQAACSKVIFQGIETAPGRIEVRPRVQSAAQDVIDSYNACAYDTGSEVKPKDGGIVATSKPPVKIDNKDVVIDVEAKVVKPKLAAKLMQAARKLPLGPITQAVQIFDLLNDFGLLNPKVTPEGLTAERVIEGSDCVPNQLSDGRVFSDRVSGIRYYTYKTVSINGSCFVQEWIKDGSEGTPGLNQQWAGVKSGNSQNQLLSPSEVEAVFANTGNWPVLSPRALEAVANAISNTPQAELPELIPDSNLKLNGPASVPGKTTTSSRTLPNGDVVNETKTTTNNITYQGSKINISTTTNTVTNNTTTNTSTNTTQTTTTTTTETSDEPETQTEDPCIKNPDRVGCMKVDVPDGQIPKQSKQVTYNAETWGGPGRCPDNIVLWQRGGNQAVMPIQDICPYLATYVKSIIIALSLFTAFLIVLPGETRL